MTLSRRRYKNYKKRSPRKRGRSRGGKKLKLRWIIVLLVIITAGVFITKQLGKSPDVNDPVGPDDPLGQLINESAATLGGGGDDSGVGPIVPDDGIGSPLPPVVDGITSTEAKASIVSAGNDIKAGKVISARNKLNRILHDMDISNKDRQKIKVALTDLSDRWLFSKKIFDDDTLTGSYKVVSGDVFSTIGRKYKVPYEILMDVNGIKNAKGLPLRKIKVVKGPFRVKIQLSKFNMDLYLQDQYVKSYKIGIGKPGEDTTTPTGKWRLKRAGKSDQGPSWPNPETGKMVVASDPGYPLGARWIPITCLKGEGEGRTGFALHGTKDPKSIGTRCSLGCIRLSNEDVIEVYKMLAAGISLVDIDK
jgi:LysM repeat protein